MGGTFYNKRAILLQKKKIKMDYFPRGVNEIFPEFYERSQNFPDMVIEPSMALYLPLPTYIFVSPNLTRKTYGSIH